MFFQIFNFQKNEKESFFVKKRGGKATTHKFSSFCIHRGIPGVLHYIGKSKIAFFRHFLKIEFLGVLGFCEKSIFCDFGKMGIFYVFFSDFFTIF